MEKIKKILAPTDLSELSRAGVRYALNLARALGAEVTVYHVVDQEDLMQSPNSVLERYQLALARFLNDHFSDLTPWLKVREKLEIGRPEENIVERARKEGSDLIVISTHGGTGLSHVFVGSVTEKVVRTAPCPVLSIHPQQAEKTTQKTAAVA